MRLLVNCTCAALRSKADMLDLLEDNPEGKPWGRGGGCNEA
jgi:hypothetical protein